MRKSLALLVFALLICAVHSAPTLPTTVRRRGGSGRGGWSRSRKSSTVTNSAAAALQYKAKKKKKKVKSGLSGILTEEEEEEGSLEEDVYSCFPARALVQVDGRSIRMDALHVGNTVRTGPNSVSDVFMFSHAVNSGIFQFLRFTCAAGELTVSPGHFVHTARGTFAARDIVRGDFLKAANGSMTKVILVEQVVEEGLYNPQTIDGDVVVDGFVVSTFTQAIPVQAAASMLAPVRAAYAILGVDVTGGLIAADSVVRTILVSVLKAMNNAHRSSSQFGV